MMFVWTIWNIERPYMDVSSVSHDNLQLWTQVSNSECGSMASERKQNVSSMYLHAFKLCHCSYILSQTPDRITNVISDKDVVAKGIPIGTICIWFWTELKASSYLCLSCRVSSRNICTGVKYVLLCVSMYCIQVKGLLVVYSVTILDRERNARTVQICDWTGTQAKRQLT